MSGELRGASGERRTRSDGPLLDAIHDLRAGIEFQRVITVRMPATCHAVLLEDAHAARRSMNDHCLALLFAAHEEFFAGLTGRQRPAASDSPLAPDPQPSLLATRSSCRSPSHDHA